MAALSAQAIGRGADGILFFQWRQSRAGAEKFHSAMLPHAGTDTRTWREVVELGAQLAALPELPAGARDARVALVFDWENWWAVERTDHPRGSTTSTSCSAGTARCTVAARAGRHRAARARRRAVRPRDRAAALPAPRRGRRGAHAFVEGGGHLLAGPFTDVVDEDDRFRAGGFLTQLGGLFGVRLEDFGALVSPMRPDGGPANARRDSRERRFPSRSARSSPRRSR